MVIYPGDWEVKKLGDIGKWESGSTPSRNNPAYYASGDIFWVKSGELNDSILTKTEEKITQKALNETAVKLQKPGAVIIAMYGATIGKIAILGVPATTNQACCACEVFDGVCNRFLFYTLMFHREKIKALSAGAAQPNISKEIITNYSIPLPPLKEQTAIANTLAAFDTHITNLTELITKKKAIRDGALDELMTGRTRLKGFCGDWEVKRLLDCVRLVQGLTYAPNNVSSYGTLVLRSSNIQDNSLSLEDNVYVNMQIAQEKMIQEGDILVCVRNGSSDLIGKSCRLPALSNTTFGAFMSVLRGDKTGYIAKIFNSLIVQKQVRNRTSATINQITKKDFEDIIIPLPPLDEQIAIADTLSALDKEISSLETERAKISSIRDGAINDLLTGKVRLKIGI